MKNDPKIIIDIISKNGEKKRIKNIIIHSSGHFHNLTYNSIDKELIYFYPYDIYFETTPGEPCEFEIEDNYFTFNRKKTTIVYLLYEKNLE